MALLTQTVTTETTINWEELAQKIRKNESGLKVGDIITEQTKDGEELDLVVVDMGPGWARFESKDCLPEEVPYNKNGSNAGGFAESGVKWHLDNIVFPSLPEELQAVISEVERVQAINSKARTRNRPRTARKRPRNAPQAHSSTGYTGKLRTQVLQKNRQTAGSIICIIKRRKLSPCQSMKIFASAWTRRPKN